MKPRRAWPRTWPLAAALLAGAAAVILMLVTREPGHRWAALALAAAGLAAGAVAGRAAASARTRRLVATPAAPRERSMAERVNDVAFLVVVTAVWALLLALPGPWSGLVTGVLVGAALGFAWRPA